jgi:hypothetical protein
MITEKAQIEIETKHKKYIEKYICYNLMQIDFIN